MVATARVPGGTVASLVTSSAPTSSASAWSTSMSSVCTSGIIGPRRIRGSSRQDHRVNTSDLDAWLPDPAIRTRHRRDAAADPDALWAAARAIRLDDTGTIGRLVRWRIPGVPAHQTFAGVIATDPFTVLDEGERWSVSGLCGRIWTLARDYHEIRDAEDFRAFAAPRSVRVLLAHWVRESA